LIFAKALRFSTGDNIIESNQFNKIDYLDINVPKYESLILNDREPE